MLLSLSNTIQLRLLQDRWGCLRSSLYPLARLIAFTLFVLVQDSLLAQAPEGAIRGIVNDVTGAVVAKASLRVTQPQFGGGRIVRTDGYGRYYITISSPAIMRSRPSPPASIQK